MWQWRHLRRPYRKNIREQFVNWIYWHLTFMWPLIAVGLVYVTYQICSGNYRQVLFSAKDLPGVWPMVCHYFLFGPKPELKESYNPLQNFAYTIAIFLGALAVLSGLVLYKPVQLFGLAWLVGGCMVTLLQCWVWSASSPDT